MDHDWLQALFALWQQPDQATDLEAAFADFYTDPVIVNGVELSIADMVARARSLNAAFNGLTADILEIVEGRDRSLGVAFMMRGRHTGPYRGPLGLVEATGLDVEIRTIDILTLSDGKVSKIWVNADDLGLLRQLGAVSGTAVGSV
ncbi:MAG TPA: ester cyclase [Propionibacteriaceae bacterium]|nr:ester cyclase [Propionibacteriaceae bacterium]